MLVREYAFPIRSGLTVLSSGSVVLNEIGREEIGNTPVNQSPSAPAEPIFPDERDAAGALSAGTVTQQGRAYPYWAWLVILLAAGTIIGLQRRGPREDVRLAGAEMLNDLQARYVVGVSQLAGRSDILQPSLRDGFGGDSLSKGLRWTLLLSDAGKHDAALAELTTLGQSLAADAPEQEELLSAVRALVESRSRDEDPQQSLTAGQMEQIRVNFGWLGRLAVTARPGEPSELRRQLIGEARRTAGAFVGLSLVAISALLVGFGLLVCFGVLVAIGRIRFRLRCPTGTGGFYAETFALWFVTFFALNLGIGWVAPAGFTLAASGVASGLSLLTLYWPVWRGVPARQVRAELGLNWPDQGWREVLLGGLGYVGGLPILMMGMLLTFVLMQLQSVLAGPSLLAYANAPMHPIIEPLARGSWLVRLQAVTVVLLVPITEEIMFRGVFYRHLREAFGRWGWAISVVASILTSSLLFAAIHPQGVIGIPLLTAVAIVLAVLREWRGALIAPIVMHMIVNGVTTSLVLLILS